MPSDWPQARAALDMLINPSDQMVSIWMTKQHGEDFAKQQRQKASLAQVPLRSLVEGPMTIPGLITPENVLERLARMGVGRESIDVMREIQESIPDATLTDMALEIARTEHHVPETGTGITVTTMHSAKGREWDAVVLAGLEQEVTPGTRDGAIEEERRVVYVGATRARRILVLSHARARRANWGQKRLQEATPSQFIAELLTF